MGGGQGSLCSQAATCPPCGGTRLWAHQPDIWQLLSHSMARSPGSARGHGPAGRSPVTDMRTHFPADCRSGFSLSPSVPREGRCEGAGRLWDPWAGGLGGADDLMPREEVTCGRDYLASARGRCGGGRHTPKESQVDGEQPLRPPTPKTLSGFGLPLPLTLSPS